MTLLKKIIFIGIILCTVGLNNHRAKAAAVEVIDIANNPILANLNFCLSAIRGYLVDIRLSFASLSELINAANITLTETTPFYESQVHALNNYVNDELGMILVYLDFSALEKAFKTNSFQEFFLPSRQELLNQANGLDSLQGTGVHQSLYQAIPTQLSNGMSVTREFDYYRRFDLVDLSYEKATQFYDATLYVENILQNIYYSVTELADLGFVAMFASNIKVEKNVTRMVDAFFALIRDDANLLIKTQCLLNESRSIQESRQRKSVQLFMEKSSSIKIANYLNRLKYRR